MRTILRTCLLLQLTLLACVPVAWAAEESALPRFDELSREELVLLCQRYLQRVRDLEAQLAASQPAPAQAQPPDDVAQLRDDLAKRDEQLLQLTRRIERLEDQARQPPVVIVREGDADEPPPLGELISAKYRYEWQTSLIGVRGSGSYILKDRNGEWCDTVDVNWHEYERNKIRFTCWFTNEHTEPARFNLVVAVGSPRKGFTKDLPPLIAGRAVHTTPVLAPGQWHSFEIDITVTDVRDVRSAGLEKVQAYKP